MRLPGIDENLPSYGKEYDYGPWVKTRSLNHYVTSPVVYSDYVDRLVVNHPVTGAMRRMWCFFCDQFQRLSGFLFSGSKHEPPTSMGGPSHLPSNQGTQIRFVQLRSLGSRMIWEDGLVFEPSWGSLTEVVDGI